MNFNIYNRQKALPISKSSVRRVLGGLCSFLRIQCEEISVYFVSEKKICQLHVEFFNDPSLTDCISFPVDAVHTARGQDWHVMTARDKAELIRRRSTIPELGRATTRIDSAKSQPVRTCQDWTRAVYLGDIFICPLAAQRFDPARPYEETLLYLIHGILHLIGYDDIEPNAKRSMRKMEKKCMDHLKQLKLKITP